MQVAELVPPVSALERGGVADVEQLAPGDGFEELQTRRLGLVPAREQPADGAHAMLRRDPDASRGATTLLAPHSGAPACTAASGSATSRVASWARCSRCVGTLWVLALPLAVLAILISVDLTRRA